MAEEAHEYPEPRFYSREFKLATVRLSETSEKTVAQIARDLGVPERAVGGHGSALSVCSVSRPAAC